MRPSSSTHQYPRPARPPARPPARLPYSTTRPYIYSARIDPRPNVGFTSSLGRVLFVVVVVVFCCGCPLTDPGHGADNLPADLPDPMTVRQCQLKCSLDPGCSAIVFQGNDHSGVGMCYLKANVDITECDEGSSFDTYLAGTTF